jgi:glycosyltransferase involved in cell wall biosynthesis
MELTVIIPTHNRRPILAEALTRLEREAADVQFEAVVINDGSTDDTSDYVRAHAERCQHPVRLIELSGAGPAIARNRGLAVAEAPVCLFIDDDCWPRPGFLARHRDFHARRPEREAALLGMVELASTPPPTEFMRWLHDRHLGLLSIADRENAGGGRFLSGNVSAKTEFLREMGGFHEGLPDGEDIDLGLRLERAGMRLAHDPAAAVEHCAPTDLPRTLARMTGVGKANLALAERHPDRRAIPNKPSLKHRVGAAALTVPAAIGVRTRSLRRETWRFLCDQALREAYWSDDSYGFRGSGAPPAPRIGRTLRRLAVRDREAQMPAGIPG